MVFGVYSELPHRFNSFFICRLGWGGGGSPKLYVSADCRLCLHGNYLGQGRCPISNRICLSEYWELWEGGMPRHCVVRRAGLAGRAGTPAERRQREERRDARCRAAAVGTADRRPVPARPLRWRLCTLATAKMGGRPGACQRLLRWRRC